MKTVLFLTVALLVSACQPQPAVMGSRAAAETSEPPTIMALDRLTAKEGDVVQVVGSNLSTDISVEVGGVSVMLQLKSSSNAFFIMPKALQGKEGTIGATFLASDQANLGSFALSSSSEAEPLPIIEADPSLICSDVVYHNPLGRLLKGLRNCRVSETSTPTPDCTEGNAVGCITTVAYPSVQKSLITAGILKNDFTLNGVTGQYPSSTFPLPTTDGYSDVDTASFQTRLKSPTPFAWFDRSGTRYSTTGNSDLDAANIRHNITLFGSTGNYAPPCTTDGEVNCLTHGSLVAAETANFDSYDIRWNKSIAGVAGARKQFGSGSQLSRWNNSASVSSTNSATPDRYDSVDDWNAGNSFPTEMPAGAAPFTLTHWLRDAGTDNGAGGGASGNEICDGTEVCLYTDRFTGSMWTADNASTYSWEAAIAFCEGVSAGGHSDWRLPTLKESLQAHINGIWALTSPLHLDSNYYYWTATTDGANFGNARRIYYDSGATGVAGKGDAYHVICMR